MRRLPLRTRLAILTTAAVAIAIAVAAAVAWLLVRDQLRGQLDESLRGQASAPAIGHFKDSCEHLAPRGGPPGPPEFGMLIIEASGRPCGSTDYAAVVTGADRAVARQSPGSTRLRDGVTASGVSVRVITVSLGGGSALMLSRPLTDTLITLDRLAVLLAVVAGIGIAGAGAAGLLVARAGLRPVDRLTDAVEHVARTEDLHTTIPVEGRDEIARLSASFNAMTAALATSRDRQQQLIADAGHELRTPLTSLRANIDLLLRSERTGRELPPERRLRLLADVKSQLGELSDLLVDLLELSRPDARRGTTMPVAWHDSVAHAVSRARLRGPGQRIEADIEPWYVRGNPGALERAAVNLLDNAVKFSRENDVVEVRLGTGVLTVRDHGPGVSAEDLPHVFERFWRSPSARALPGTGLGLAIVARAVHEAGGSVSLEAAPGGGTVARVTLPGSPVPLARSTAD